MGEIRAPAARGYDTLPVALCPGVLGKKLASQLKALNAQLWKLYETLTLPVALPNKLRLAAAALSWGGLDNDPAWVLGEQDFPTWTPSDLDQYKPPPDWSIEAKRPKSTMIEVWRQRALAQSLVFSLLYGNHAPSGQPHLTPRTDAVGNCISSTYAP